MVFPRSPEESMPQAPADRRRRRRRRETAEDVQRLSDRRAQERRRQKFAIGIGVALIFVVLAIVGVGYYIEFFRPPVTRVAGLTSAPSPLSISKT